MPCHNDGALDGDGVQLLSLTSVYALGIGLPSRAERLTSTLSAVMHAGAFTRVSFT